MNNKLIVSTADLSRGKYKKIPPTNADKRRQTPTFEPLE
jgi:hypothetical protein